MNQLDKYEWREIDGKFVFTITSKPFESKNEMLAKLSKMLSIECEKEVIFHQLRILWNNGDEHRITLAQLKAALLYVTTYLNSREDPFISSSCSLDFQMHMEHLQFMLQCEVESLERRKQESYRIG
jgi:hypothetical protein